MSSVPWQVYIIETDRGHLYTGVTTSIARRLEEHKGIRSGGAKYFRGQAPQRVRYLESVPDRATAQRREHAIKSMTRLQKLALVASHQESLA
jgi:putative endonuclease